MSTRGKSLLEAFKNGGPSAVAPEAQAAPPPPPPSLGLLRDTTRTGVTLRPAHLQLLALVQVILLVLAFLTGRMSAHSSQAAQGGIDPGARDPGAVSDAQDSGAAVDRQARTPAEAAIQNPVNRYTIQLADYANSEKNKQIASAALNYLVGTHELPAVIVGTDTRLYLLVGAAESQADLTALLERVHAIDGPPPGSKRREFHDALITDISRYSASKR
jgi:hypothetical protein